MKKLLLTGATGMIGIAIIEKALCRGWNITCIVNPNSTREANIPKHEHVNIIRCDILNYASLQLEQKYDAFIHLAWNKTSGTGRDDVDVQLANIHATLGAVRLAKRAGCRVFIGAGSQAEYGVQKVDLTSILPVQPESGYGIAKYTAGKLSALLCKQLGIRFNWLRILSVYGKYDGENTLINYVIKELKNGNSPNLTKCEQIWDYLNAEDAAMAFLAVVEKGVAGKFYPLGSGTGKPLSEYVLTIQKIINPNIALNFGAKNYYPHQPMYLVADISELTQDTGWKPNIDFAEGIQKIL